MKILVGVSGMVDSKALRKAGRTVRLQDKPEQMCSKHDFLYTQGTRYSTANASVGIPTEEAGAP